MTIEQAVYQITQTASYDERLWAVEKIIQSLKDTAPKSQQLNIAKKRYENFANTTTQNNDEPTLLLSREEIAKKRLGFFQGQITMSDDFDEYLGDEFWLGKDA